MFHLIQVTAKPKRRAPQRRGHKPGARGSASEVGIATGLHPGKDHKGQTTYADGVLRTNEEWKAIRREFQKQRAGELGQLTL